MNQEKHRTPVIPFSIMIGFFAGLFIGSLRMLGHYFHFSKLHPTFIAEPFFQTRMLHHGFGWLLGLSCFIVFSILCALLYAWLLRRVKGPWFGIGYGGFWWMVLFVVGGPLFHLIRKVYQWDLDTMLMEACLFLMWGLFIGYSISFEFTDERKRQS